MHPLIVLRYHVPEHISKHIDYITPGVKLYAGPGAEKKRREMDLMKRGFGLPPLMSPLPSDVVIAAHAPAPSNINQCDRIVEPQCIRALYNITIGTTAAKNNELGIFEDLGDIYDKPDLKLFLSTLTNISANTQPVAKPIDGAPGPTTQDNAGGESLLDLSIAMPLVYPQKVWLYQTDDAYYETHYNYNVCYSFFLLLTQTF
jgi:tripeptidyl-peptidase-1